MFYPTLQANLILYSHIMDYKILKIFVKNASDSLFQIFCQLKLSYLLDMTYENYFFTDTHSAFNAVAVPPSLHSFFNLIAQPMLLLTDFLKKNSF